MQISQREELRGLHGQLRALLSLHVGPTRRLMQALSIGQQYLCPEYHNPVKNKVD
jgi:hypothetical protein